MTAATARREKARQRVLGMMVAKGDLVEVDGAPTHFLMPISADLLDALAAFGSEFEDLEPEPDEESDDPHGEDNGEAEPESEGTYAVRRPFIVAARRRLGLPVSEPPPRPREVTVYVPEVVGPGGLARMVPVR